MDADNWMQVSITVDKSMTAARFAAEPGELFPEVLSTPHLIAHLERACALHLAPLLTSGRLSVGARIEVSHVAPTPVGAELVARARLNGQDGRLYWFDVEATDPSGVVAKGRIARAIVNEADIMARSGRTLTSITGTAPHG